MDFLGSALTLRYCFADLIFSVVATALAALWCWYFNAPLAGRRIGTFLVLTPLSVFILLAALEYIASFRVDSEPKLRAHIDALMVDKIPVDYHKDGTSILVFASIVNSGSPSVAGVFRLRVTTPSSPGSPSFLLTPDGLPMKITVTPPNGNSFVVDRSGDLADKVALSPIGAGAKVTGVLLFLAEGRSVDLMRQAGNKYDLVFEDCNEKVWEAPYIYPAKSVTTPKS